MPMSLFFQLISANENPASRMQLGPVALTFEVSGCVCSGLQIRFLRVCDQDRAYIPQRWIRYITTADSYIVKLWRVLCGWLIKGALYGIELSTQNGNIWPTRERQHRQYLKISCWHWRCCAAERWTKLRQLTRQACRVITVVAIFNLWLLKVILNNAVVETSVIDWKRVARVVFDSNSTRYF